MQTRIIEKASKLGLDIGDGSTSLDNLRAIASQVGLHEINSLDDANKIDSVLSQKLREKELAEHSKNTDVTNQAEQMPIRNNKIGQKEYDQAKKDGVYDPNHYKARQEELNKKVDDLKNERNKDWKMKKGEKGPVKADGSNTKRKTKMDRVMDNINIAKAKKDAVSNKIAGVKADLYNKTHPVEYAKDAAKGKAKDAAKQAGKQVADKGKAAAGAAGKKLAGFLMKNPYVLAVIGVVGGFFLLLLLLGGSMKQVNGQYSQECNFNASTVNLTTCNSSESKSVSVQDYVVGTTYSLVGDNSYSDDVIKAIMIVVKTNALSFGAYDGNQKILELDDCIYSYAEDVPDATKSNYNSLYSSISNYIYVSSSFTSVMNNMSVNTALNIDNEVIKKMSEQTTGYADILKSIYNKEETTEDTGKTEYRESLFLGDSRLKGMVISGAVNETNAVYGVGYGYNWLIGSGNFSSSSTNSMAGGIEGINSKLVKGKNYNIVTWLGVNDLSYKDANAYYSKYYELATGSWSNNTIYVVSVGPVKNSRNVSNDSINTFNDTMKNLIVSSGLNNLKFINVNYNISSYDSEGLHYGNSDYKNIYSIIQSNLDNSIAGDYALYDLGAHCTTYTLAMTNNSSYWWPIGSKEPTNGNIYGGTPSSTRITSTFGPREMYGTTKPHGAMDIGAECNQNVVIAAKDGVIKYVSNSCSNNGYYGSKCGGGFGNYVKIEHSDGTVTIYAHLYPNSITVSVGDTVAQGQKIGMVGNSGSSTGCHLHFQMEINNARVDPLDYVDPDNPRPTSSISCSNVQDSLEGGQQNVCRALMACGYSNNAVIGIMANIQGESGFKTTSVNSSSGAFGLVQWLGNRKTNLLNYLNSNGYSKYSMLGQLSYMNNEFKTSYKPTYNYLLGNHSAYDMGYFYCMYFEVPAIDIVFRDIKCKTRMNSNINSNTTFVNNNCN